MLNKIQKVISYFVFGIIILFAFAFLSKQLSLTYHLRESLLHTNNANLNIENLKNITRLHQSSARIFLLAFFSFIIIITGFAIVNNGINKAYDIAEVKEKVRLHLKSTTTGLLMIVAGVFLLAFCSYKHSNIETFYNLRLVHNNRNNLVNPKHILQDDAPLHIDSTMLPKVQKPTNNLVRNSKSKLNEQSSIKERKTNQPLSKLSVSINKNISGNSTSTQPQKNQNTNHNINNYVSIPISNNSRQQVNNNNQENDIDWANQLEKESVVYGYVPNIIDRRKYGQVIQQKANGLNGDMHWAYSFLQKTKQGYQPNDQELRRYEMIIEQNVMLAKQNLPNE